ncbi:MAG: LysR family transcriptional regulator [Pseudomonadota bacterium]
MTSETSSVDDSRKRSDSVNQYVSAISDADIRLLRIFCVVVSAGGLSPATGELQADLSTVSRYVKELEDHVGARLCNRGRSGFSLTPQGVVVHAAAQELFRAMKAFRENIGTLHADPVGELKLGVMDALLSDPQFRLSHALRAYRAKAPRVHVCLSVSKPLEIERQILSGVLDAGVVSSVERPAGLSYHPLYKETSSLYCSEHHPLYRHSDPGIHLGDIGILDLVEDPYTDSLPMHKSAAAFRRAARADSLEGVALLVASGDYVGFLPDHFAAVMREQAGFKRIRPDLFSYEQGIDLVWRSGPMNPFVQGVFAELCADGDAARRQPSSPARLS